MNTQLSDHMVSLADCLHPYVSDPIVDDICVRRLTLDSRQVVKDSLFIACGGQVADGHDFALEAERRGAAAVLSERVIDGLAIPNIVIPELRSNIGNIASKFYGEPSKHMTVIGITGTNGKTSVAYHLANLIHLFDGSSGYIGTLGWGSLDNLESSDLTTVDAVTLQYRMAVLRENKNTVVCMEVSSHALDQSRVNGIEFDIAVFTNLSRDHLDYHGSMEKYAAAKRSLFAVDGLRAIIANIDDVHGQEIITTADKGIQTLGFGVGEKANISWKDLTFTSDKISGTVMVDTSAYQIALPLYGEFGVHNFCAALGVMMCMGYAPHDVIRAGSNLSPVPGRMEFVRSDRGYSVVVDFAHTPDALEKALVAAKSHAKGRLICVFGCGGDRDKGKRKEMATVAEKRSDKVWVTNDNPRTESPENIVSDILEGFREPALIEVTLDRKQAIEKALLFAASGDVVLIAGKGHEDYQDIRGKKTPFSDVQVVQSILGVAH